MEIHTSGLDAHKFKEVKLRLLQTGEFDPELWNLLDSNQKFWVNETKKSYRDLQDQ